MWDKFIKGIFRQHIKEKVQNLNNKLTYFVIKTALSNG